MSWVQPYHAQCARQWLSATATASAMHVARPRSRPSHATQRPFRTHYRTYPGAARGVDITSRQHVDQRLRRSRSMPATRGKWGKSNACAWSTQHAHQKQHPCTVRHHPDAHIAHGCGLAHAPVSARAKMIDLLPHLDSLVGRCSAVPGTSRKGGRAPLCPRAADVVHDLFGPLASLFDQLDRPDSIFLPANSVVALPEALPCVCVSATHAVHKRAP